MHLIHRGLVTFLFPSNYRLVYLYYYHFYTPQLLILQYTSIFLDKNLDNRFKLCYNILSKTDAEVAELADAQDLKSCGINFPYRFDPGFRHHKPN